MVLFISLYNFSRQLQAQTASSVVWFGWKAFFTSKDWNKVNSAEKINLMLRINYVEREKTKIAKDHWEMQNMSIILLQRNVFIYNLNLRLLRRSVVNAEQNLPVLNVKSTKLDLIFLDIRAYSTNVKC